MKYDINCTKKEEAMKKFFEWLEDIRTTACGDANRREGIGGCLGSGRPCDAKSMGFDKYKDLAIKYKIDDLIGASIPGSRISNILNELELNKKLSCMTQVCLQEKGFFALLSYARNEVSYADFLKIAKLEQTARVKTAEEVAATEKARQKIEREAFLAKQETLFAKQKSDEKSLFAKLNNDPRNRAKERQSKLREKYGLTRYIEKDDFAKLMDILRRADKGERLSDEEVVWLSEKRYGNDEYYYDDSDNYFTEELRRKYHENEAKFYHGEFEKK